MGVLNVTPDSFSDGGAYLTVEHALQQARQMQAEGADIIDIGAESSRPGAQPIDETEELRRLLPVLEAVHDAVPLPISVDTTKAAVARRAIRAGATIVNDISALRGDPLMGSLVAETGAAVVLMHMQGTPQSMQQAPRYGHVVEERCLHSCANGCRSRSLTASREVRSSLIPASVLVSSKSIIFNCSLSLTPSRSSVIRFWQGSPVNSLSGT